MHYVEYYGPWIEVEKNAPLDVMYGTTGRKLLAPVELMMCFN